MMSTLSNSLLFLPPNFQRIPPTPHVSIVNFHSRVRSRSRQPKTLVFCSTTSSEKPAPSNPTMGSDVEAVPSETDRFLSLEIEEKENGVVLDLGLARKMLDWALLVSPFFFWGTTMVVMKEVMPKTGPFFVSAVRLIPAGALLIGFAAIRGRKLPSGFLAWISIILFGVVDAACFQGFLAEGLQRTSAGLGSVIIDSQPLTVAILASLLFALVNVQVPSLSSEGSSSIWGSGEWWMLLAAQSSAVGTVMIRWVSKYSDPVMATGWHMLIGGLPLLAISILNNDPAVKGSLSEFTSGDVLALLYTSIFGSAVSYGVFFYNATRGSLTKLSSLTFLTPMFASIFGYLYLGETFSNLQLLGALVTLVSIYMVNYRDTVNEE
ncbi:WAT1-related protein At3g02690, chloroplastic isoform X2 [Dioscorea cayenensis subsp. rotundata]|uniref:WAT1-related protein At3g02690, chloroplastic isoform X2 n=1 Tax=Dioscorea cayennensis subsp. rotundata TaxID=55577 RepID=A0AB40CFD1_DIOCR|nr:WAT1-related protein At3g02690, chloroplastic isoform X2 [Dioscorea cayenensis subsp. rotundata]